jgi:hypothetical protein
MGSALRQLEVGSPYLETLPGGTVLAGASAPPVDSGVDRVVL